LIESGELPDSLQQVTLETVDYRSPTCSPSVNRQIQLCAGVPDGTKGYYHLLYAIFAYFLVILSIDSCQGDSGGPLMMFTPSRQWVLVGIVSSGDGCANVSSAGRYTRVAAFEGWIKSHTNASYWILNDSTFSTIPSVVNTTSILNNSSTTTMLSNSTTRSKSSKSLISIYSNTNSISIVPYHLYLAILLISVFPSFSRL
jgi:secreted trypsin-like serine protease